LLRSISLIFQSPPPLQLLLTPDCIVDDLERLEARSCTPYFAVNPGTLQVRCWWTRVVKSLVTPT